MERSPGGNFFNGNRNCEREFVTGISFNNMVRGRNILKY